MRPLYISPIGRGGVDFGIQFAVRYRQRRHILAEAGDDDLDHAIVATAARAGPGILLAALAVAGGFFAFLPTAYLGVSELQALYRSRQVSPVEVAEAVLARIERIEPRVNAMMRLTPEHALAAARREPGAQEMKQSLL